MLYILLLLYYDALLSHVDWFCAFSFFIFLSFILILICKGLFTQCDLAIYLWLLSFCLKGRGTVATGRVEQGTIKVGEDVEILGLMQVDV